MPQAYKKRAAEWWNERRIEIYRLFSEGHNASYISKLEGEDGKHLFPGSQEIRNVQKAFENLDDPFAKPTTLEDTGDGGDERDTDVKQKPTPQLKGSTFIATVKPRVITLDPRLFILYDLLKVVHPEYDRDEGTWLYEVVTAFYSEHSEEFELGRLFTQAENQPQPANAEEEKDGEGKEIQVSTV